MRAAATDVDNTTPRVNNPASISVGAVDWFQTNRTGSRTFRALEMRSAAQSENPAGGTKKLFHKIRRMMYIACKYRHFYHVMTKKTTVWIRGAGIAGLTAAWHLTRAGFEVVVTDTSGVGSGASGAWWALLNPATGIKATPATHFEQGVTAFETMANELGVGHAPWIRQGIVRPALDKTLEKGFSASASNLAWPEGWVEWKQGVHGLAGNGALMVHRGYAIDTRLWMTTITEALRKQGVEVREHVPDHLSIDTDVVLHATGADILHDPIWSHLTIHAIKGQLREVKVTGIRGTYSALSSRGYAVQIDDGHWILGSTYEHEFTDPYPDSAFDAYILDRFRAMFPQPIEITIIGRWSGIRVGSGNRAPILAEHPTKPGHFVMTALGSKGLLYSQILSQKLVRELSSRTV
jgi:glycine/D-amino acid oxidase-like deaminating enzyme